MIPEDSQEYTDDITILSTPIDDDRAEDSEEFYTHDFSLRGMIGKGGVGHVLLGYDKRIGREVAIKELLPPEESGPDDERSLERFTREARITGRLEHPGIVPVYEFGEREDGTNFYVMKYIRGRTLKSALKECETETKEQSLRNRMHYLDSLIDVCEAMAFAHSKGFTHRDLKPGNVVLGDYGETSILDWGLAKAKTERAKEFDKSEVVESKDVDGELTIQGEILGTPAYMAPEQVDPSFGDIGPQADVYALGTILYQILTGKTPYSGGPQKIILDLISKKETPVASDDKMTVPQELVAICSKAMNKKVSERFANAGEMVEQLKAYREGRVVSVYAYSPKELLKRFLAKNKALVSAVAVVVVAIVFTAVLSHKARLEAEEAKEEAVVAHKEAVKAKDKAEKALYEITEASDEALFLVRKMNSSLDDKIEGLIKGMEDAAVSLSSMDLDNAVLMYPQLQKLKEKYSGVESFMTIKAPGTISSVYPEKYDGLIGQDISSQEHIRWIFANRKRIFSRVFKAVEGFYAVTAQVPIVSGNVMVGALAAVIKPHDFVKTVVKNLPSRKNANIWLMQDDGRIIYDDDVEQVGLNLFKSELYQNYPELRQFGKTSLKRQEGLGHYTFLDTNTKETVHKIGAWQTTMPSESAIWKVIVVKRYDD